MSRLRRAVGFESAVTAGLALVGLYLVVAGASLGLGKVSAPEAGSFTFLAGVALALLSVAQLFAGGRVAGPSVDPAAAELPPSAWRRAVALIAALVVYTAVLEVLGFVLSTVLLSAAVMKISSRPRWTVVAAVSVAASLLVYLVFDVLLGVSLPSGTLFQR